VHRQAHQRLDPLHAGRLPTPATASSFCRIEKAVKQGLDVNCALYTDYQRWSELETGTVNSSYKIAF